ncbi:MAG: hypothetical protein NUV84_01935 [Candidatus Uhrbacteria bacterium]|nr:hypothetical protein [Candidatus Uhrbacteria bacterium]
MILFQLCPYHFPELLGAEHPEFLARTIHGFLVDDGHLVEHAYVIDGQYRIHELRKEGLNIPDECLARAQAFSLPENYERLEWAASMGRGHDRRTRCLPCARQTWPPT